MQNEVIEQVHRLARTAEKYERIVFTDMQDNILEEQIDDDDDNHEVMDEDTDTTYYENDEEQSTN